MRIYPIILMDDVLFSRPFRVAVNLSLKSATFCGVVLPYHLSGLTRRHI